MILVRMIKLSVQLLEKIIIEKTVMITGEKIINYQKKVYTIKKKKLKKKKKKKKIKKKKKHKKNILE